MMWVTQAPAGVMGNTMPSGSICTRAGRFFFRMIFVVLVKAPISGRDTTSARWEVDAYQIVKQISEPITRPVLHAVAYKYLAVCEEGEDGRYCSGNVTEIYAQPW